MVSETNQHKILNETPIMNTTAIAKTNALNWFELYASDLDRAHDFYEAVLKETLEKIDMEGMRMSMFACDQKAGIGGCLTQMEGCQPGGGGTLVYLNVEGKLDEVIERIPKAGGKIVRPKFAIPPHGFIAIFEDSEGNVVGLHSMC